MTSASSLFEVEVTTITSDDLNYRPTLGVIYTSEEKSGPHSSPL